MKSLLLATVLLFVLAGASHAQAIAAATSTATIVSPISISKTADMNFGNLAVSASAGGIVTLEASASATRSLSGSGVTFPVVSGTVTAARFTIAGTPNYTFDITLPGGAVLENSVNSMFANNFTASTGAGLLDASGIQVVYVGANLSVAASQAPGVYITTTPFVVAVNYN
jgi:hypothetical protein